MGMYTEFYFRANVKEGPVADWLDANINGDDDWFRTPFDEHEFFTCDRWTSVFIGGGAVYQESRTPIFRRKAIGSGEPYYTQLVLASSLKNYGGELDSFIEWITPHLEMCHGDFLGYSLYEDSQPSGLGWDRDVPDDDNECPHLYFMRLTGGRA